MSFVFQAEIYTVTRAGIRLPLAPGKNVEFFIDGQCALPELEGREASSTLVMDCCKSTLNQLGQFQGRKEPRPKVLLQPGGARGIRTPCVQVPSTFQGEADSIPVSDRHSLDLKCLVKFIRMNCSGRAMEWRAK